MSLTIFLGLCVLGLDFMIYALFKLFYGDRRSLIARRVAAQRQAARAEAAGLIFVPALKSTLPRKQPSESTDPRQSVNQSEKLFSRNSYTTRVA